MPAYRSIPFAAALLLCLALSSLGALAQNAAPRPLATQVKEWQKTLDDAERELAQQDIPDARLDGWNDRLTLLRLAARAAVATDPPEARAARGDLAALGPPPAEGAPPESPGVAAQRKALGERLAAAEGAVKQAGLVSARADRLLVNAKALSRSRFAGRILARGQSPLSPPIWRKALPELGTAFESLDEEVKSALSGGGWREWLGGLAWRLGLGLTLGILLAFPLRGWLVGRLGYVEVEDEDRPTYLQRLWVAAFTGFVGALLPSAAAAALYFSLAYGGFLAGPPAEVFRVGLAALAGLFFVTGFARAALAPFAPEWRLVPIHNAGARALSRSISALAALFALDRVLGELCEQY
jgi:potassium efflux system protein